MHTDKIWNFVKKDDIIFNVWKGKFPLKFKFIRQTDYSVWGHRFHNDGTSHYSEIIKDGHSGKFCMTKSECYDFIIENLKRKKENLVETISNITDDIGKNIELKLSCILKEK